MAARFSTRFVWPVIDNVNNGKESLIIPQSFEERKVFTTRLPFSMSKRSFTKTFFSNLKNFTGEK